MTEKIAAVGQLIRYNKVYHPFNSVSLTLTYFYLHLYSSELKAKARIILIRVLHIAVHSLGQNVQKRWPSLGLVIDLKVN